jgi:excisionase family DNA binding protein
MPHPTTALYVRLPHSESDKLDRAATALATNKKTLVTNLVHHYVDPDTDAGLERLRNLAATHRKVTITLPDDNLTVGHHHFTPAPTADVLTAAQAAELLQVDEADIEQLARSGDLPGRQIGEQWRFSRAALLAWLAND